jgi:hypothetical protein
MYKTMGYHIPEDSLPENPKSQHYTLVAMVMDINMGKALFTVSQWYEQNSQLRTMNFVEISMQFILVL